MNWQNNEDHFEEGDKLHTSLHDQNKAKLIQELEETKTIQLKQFEDPADNMEKQTYITSATKFGDLQVKGHLDEMIKNVLTDDCEFFIFNSNRSSSALYYQKAQGLVELQRDIEIHERQVRETYVDINKSTVVQCCNVRIKYSDEEYPIDEILAEMFTFKDNKINKYRAFFGRITPVHGDCSPFKLSRKEKALAIAKRISYAFADQPDLPKVASYLHENTQYKIWSWESHKCFTFGKHDFVEKFRSLEENLVIKCIVPYQVYTEAQYVIASFVYHLEGRSAEYANKKYIWLNTCVYTFDENLNIAKICQQGELHLEGETEIPFEGFSSEKFLKNLEENQKRSDNKPDTSIFYDGLMHTTSIMCVFDLCGLPGSGFFQGLNETSQIVEEVSKINMIQEWERDLDTYIDCNSSGYDVILLLACRQLTMDCPGYRYNHEKINVIHFVKICIENGKVAKMLIFLSEIPNPISSPFDDPHFEGVNVMKRE